MSVYDDLGVPRGASDEDIKKAYRKLVMIHHPDKGGDSETFQKVSSAYEILSDPVKRAELDVPQGFTASPKKHYEYNVTVSLDEAFLGVKKNLRITRNKECDVCNGHGVFSRQIRLGPFMQTMSQGCNVCHMRGSLPQEEQVLISFVMPKGTHTGFRITEGNITLVAQVSTHPVFTREGNTLKWEPRISFEDSIQGTVLECPHFEGTFPVATKDLDCIIDPRKWYTVRDIRIRFDILYPSVE